MITARLHALLLMTWFKLSLSWAPSARGRSDRGDVPGWVMITVMTATIVAAIWTVARQQLMDMFNNALGLVSGHN